MLTCVYIGRLWIHLCSLVTKKAGFLARSGNPAARGVWPRHCSRLWHGHVLARFGPERDEAGCVRWWSRGGDGPGHPHPPLPVYHSVRPCDRTHAPCGLLA